MKIKFTHVLIIVISNYGCSSFMKSTSKIERKAIPESVVRKDYKATTGLEIFMQADTVQIKSDKGLAFSLKLKNTSNYDITTRNSLDLIYLKLFNDAGHDIFISQPSRYKINSNSPFTYTSFNIIKVNVNGKKIKSNLDEAEEITIPAKGEYEIFLSINKVLNGLNNEKYVQISKGKYRLLASIFLVQNGHQEMRKVAPLMINYGF